ncbi:DUF6634 family protein [Paracoccus sp. KR1-242]|uniref:DUF6634 family protein n=1 Tax=Paracoccus sp. KR1-242 TaxID=3410028 RepID=UPI003BFAB9D4
MPSDHRLEDLFAQAALYDLVEGGPSNADLAHAPVLDSWVALQDRIGRVMLFGRVTDHPHLGNRVIHTSQVYGLDAAGNWARTYNRWYVLGTPYPGREKNAFELPPLHALSGPYEIRAVLAAEAGMLRAILARVRQ